MEMRWGALDPATAVELHGTFERIAKAYGVQSCKLRLSDQFGELARWLDCGGFSEGNTEVEEILRERGLPNLAVSDRVETLLQKIIDARQAGSL